MAGISKQSAWLAVSEADGFITTEQNIINENLFSEIKNILAASGSKIFWENIIFACILRRGQADGG